jgi:hypothetical protein
MAHDGQAAGMKTGAYLKSFGARRHIFQSGNKPTGSQRVGNLRANKRRQHRRQS